MPAKLTNKNCIICGTEVFGIKRKDRSSYYYPKRCSNCNWKPLDPEVSKKRIEFLNKARELREKPIGTRRKHEVSPGVFYWVIKTKPFGKWPYEHRVITNAPKGFHVHHINGDTLDNRPENLVVLSPQDHHSEHLGLFGKWSKLYNYCQDCGTTSKKHLSHGLCTTCYQRKQPKKPRRKKTLES